MLFFGVVPLAMRALIARQTTPKNIYGERITTTFKK
jgi:hypothetical protein